MRYLAIIFVLSTLAFTALSITKELKGREEFCSEKSVVSGDNLSGNYLVSGYNEKSVSMIFYSPRNALLEHISHEREGKFNVNTTEEGDYRVCFRNSDGKSVYVTFDLTVSETNKEKTLITQDLSDMFTEIRSAVKTTTSVRKNLDGQHYRAWQHNQSLSKLTSRIQWASFFKMVVMVIIAGGQMYMLTRLFRKKGKYAV